MKQPVKIKDSDHYNNLLNDFKTAFQDRIPFEENCIVTFKQDPSVSFSYGPAAVIAVVETESSGRDEYVIFIGNDGCADFVRNIT